MPRARVIRTPRASRSYRARPTEPLLLGLPGDGRSPFHLAPSLLSMRPGCLAGELVSVSARESPRPPLQALDHRPPAGIPAGPAAGGGLSGLCRPAPVTGARIRWHGVRSPAHKTFRRRRRGQSGDQPTWNAATAVRSARPRQHSGPAAPAGPHRGGTMTAEARENPVTAGVRSLEVRWFFPGQLETAAADGSGASRPRPSHARTPTSWIRSCAACR